MIYSFILPDSGEGLHESEIIQWGFKVGDGRATTALSL